MFVATQKLNYFLLSQTPIISTYEIIEIDISLYERFLKLSGTLEVHVIVCGAVDQRKRRLFVVVQIVRQKHCRFL